jgi:hypothetical protein
MDREVELSSQELYNSPFAESEEESGADWFVAKSVQLSLLDDELLSLASQLDQLETQKRNLEIRQVGLLQLLDPFFLLWSQKELELKKTEISDKIEQRRSASETRAKLPVMRSPSCVRSPSN